MPAGAAQEQSIFRATLAHGYHERFLTAGRVFDLEAAVVQHRTALDDLPRTSLFAPARSALLCR